MAFCTDSYRLTALCRRFHRWFLVDSRPSLVWPQLHKIGRSNPAKYLLFYGKMCVRARLRTTYIRNMYKC